MDAGNFPTYFDESDFAVSLGLRSFLNLLLGSSQKEVVDTVLRLCLPES